MRMGIGFVAVVPVAAIREPEFQDFPQRFDQQDIAINGSQAHGGKIRLQELVDGFHTRVTLATGQNFNNGQSLGGEFMARFPQPVYNSCVSVFMIGHRPGLQPFATLINNNDYHLTLIVNKVKQTFPNTDWRDGLDVGNLSKSAVEWIKMMVTESFRVHAVGQFGIGWAH
jgi:hypothetical protein